MLYDIDEELRDLLFEEVSNQTISYSIYKRLTGNDTKVVLEGEEFILTENDYLRLMVKRTSRKRIRFSFNFKDDERIFSTQLVRTLEGLVFYSYATNSYSVYDKSCSIGFTLDIGGRKECTDFFHKLFHGNE